jgi:predicted Zn finger-like uncharacterized protein
MELKQSVTDMITRCPKCHTSFRITQAQLQTAKGSVRCGSCLHIFKAMDHLVQDKPAALRKPAPVNKATSEPSNQARKFDNNNATVVRPLAASPKYEHKKFEYKKPKAADVVSPKDIESALRSSLEAKPNQPKPAAAPVMPRVDNSQFGIPDDILDEDKTRPLGDNEGQQNMLVFDQAAIDDEPIGGPIDDDDLMISDDMSLDGDEPAPSRAAYGDDLVESFLDIGNWAPKETSLFDRKSKPPKDEGDSDDKHSPDESWAIDLLENDEEEAPSYSGVHSALDELDLEMENPDSRSAVEEYSRATTGSFNALEDSDIEEALGEPLGEHIEPKFDASTAVSEKEFYPEFDYDNDDYEDESFGDQDYHSDYDSDYYSREERTALLKSIGPAPVEFNRFAGKRDWKKTAIWSSAVAAGIIILVVQVAWLQFNTLSRQQPYRDMYEFFGVDVPPISAPNLIRASNLVVRSHPNADDALMVDTILLNTAPFTQPFPDLVLNFSNVEGKTLAARRFKPQEYLGGELAGRTQMPVGQPVHLSLEIVDPGPEAVSYSAYIPN